MATSEEIGRLETLHKLHDGRLTDDEKAKILELIKSRPELQAEIGTLKSLGEGLRFDTNEAIKAVNHDHITTRVMAHVNEEAALLDSPPLLQRLKLLWKPALALGASAAIATLVLAKVVFSPQPNAPFRNGVVVEKLETEGVEAELKEAKGPEDEAPVPVIWIVDKNVKQN